MTSAPLRILNLVEAAALLRIHKSTLSDRAKSGLVPAAKVGRAWTFIESDLVAYLRGQYTGEHSCPSTNLNSVQGEHAEFCFTYQGRPVKEIKTAWNRANHRAGTGVLVETETGSRYTGFTWHGLRHTWATWHVQNGTPLDVLQKLGGWASYSMVLRYGHHSPGYLAGFADNTTKEKV